jgi:pilus assembly protein CpaE
VPSSSILLVGADAAAAKETADTLIGAGYAVTVVADADEAFRGASDHQVVVLDEIAGPRSAAELCREIRTTPSLAAIPVLCLARSDDVEERIGFLEAGADDVIARPFDPRELEARVEALILRFQRSRDLAPIATAIGAMAPERRRLVVVFSPKGGTGVTTIATNLGMVAATRKPDSAVVVDLDLQFGQVATHLNLPPRQTLADVIRDESSLEEAELLRTYTSRHDAGLHVLVAPGTPDLAAMVTATHVERVLRTLPGTFDTIVVDAGSSIDERTLCAFDLAELVVFPVYPEIAALKALHALVEFLTENGSVAAKAMFVLNGMFAKEILKLRDVEGALGTRVAASLPYDPFLYLKAVNEGVPVVLGAPRSLQAEALTKLATAVFGGDGSAAPVGIAPTVAEERKSGLFGGLRRR